MFSKIFSLIIVSSTLVSFAMPEAERVVVKTDGDKTFIGDLEFANLDTTVLEFSKVFGKGRPVFLRNSVYYFYDDFGFKLVVTSQGLIDEMTISLEPSTPDQIFAGPLKAFSGKLIYMGVEFDRNTKRDDLLAQLIKEKKFTPRKRRARFPSSLPAGSNGWWFFSGSGANQDRVGKVAQVTLMSHPDSPVRANVGLLKKHKEANGAIFSGTMKFVKADLINVFQTTSIDYQNNGNDFKALTPTQKKCFLMSRFDLSMDLDGLEFFYGQEADLDPVAVVKAFQEIGANQHAEIHSKIAAIYEGGPTGGSKESLKYIENLPEAKRARLTELMKEFRKLPAWEPLFLDWDFQRQSKK